MAVESVALPVSGTLINTDTSTSWDICVRDRGVGTSPPYPLMQPTEAMEAMDDMEEIEGTEEMKEMEEAEQP